MQSILKIEDAVQGYIAITVSEGGEKKTYTVRTGVYNDLGMPCRGEELSDDALDVLRAADEYYRAKRSALSILSYGDNNAKTLYTKLRSRSISDETANEVVCEMVSLGYINESRQLERLIVEDSNRKLLGPRKIVPRLLSRGYALADIKEAFEALTSSGEIDMNENKERLLEKYLGGDRDPEQVRRLLFKYGYDF